MTLDPGRMLTGARYSMRRSIVSIALSLAACPGVSEESGKGADSASTCCDCEVTVDSTSPANGATDAYYRDSIVFTLSDAEPTATLIAPVPGTASWDTSHTTLTFTPDAPLEHGTAYTFRLEFCGGGVDLTFTTSWVGSEPVDTELDGRAWTIALSEGTAGGMGAYTTSYLSRDLLLGAGVEEGGSIELALETPDAWCDATPVTASFADEPYVEATFSTIQLTLTGYPASLHDVTLAGVFTEDGTAFVAGTLTGSLDTRTLGALFDTSGEETSFCTAAESMGEACEACPDGEVLCYPLRIDELVGVETTPPVCP